MVKVLSGLVRAKALSPTVIPRANKRLVFKNVSFKNVLRH